MAPPTSRAAGDPSLLNAAPTYPAAPSACAHYPCLEDVGIKRCADSTEVDSGSAANKCRRFDKENAESLFESAGVQMDQASPSSCDWDLCSSPTESDVSSASQTPSELFAPAQDPELIASMYTMQRRVEARSKSPSPSIMHTAQQNNAIGKNRHTLVMWFIEISLANKLRPETLFLATSILDRFLCLSPNPVEPSKLQLVGTACIRLASKYEEIVARPDVADFADMDDPEQRQHLFEAEVEVLHAINHDLTAPTTFTFLALTLQAAGLNLGNDHDDSKVGLVAIYLALVALLDHNMLRIKPSEIASSCFALAQMAQGRAGWTSALAELTGYTDDSLLGPFHELHNCSSCHNQRCSDINNFLCDGAMWLDKYAQHSLESLVTTFTYDAWDLES